MKRGYKEKRNFAYKNFERALLLKLLLLYIAMHMACNLCSELTKAFDNNVVIKKTLCCEIVRDYVWTTDT